MGSGNRHRRAWGAGFLALALLIAAAFGYRALRQAPAVAEARTALAWLAALGPGSPGRWALPGSQAALLAAYLRQEAARAASGPLTLKGGSLAAFTPGSVTFSPGGARVTGAFVWLRRLRVRDQARTLTVRIPGRAMVSLKPAGRGWRVAAVGLTFGAAGGPTAPDSFSLPAAARQSAPPLPQGAPGD